jgi:heme ABC exporter ATP-binding subunit CcmA
VANLRDGYAIYVEGLHKSFGDWPVLWDLDLKVEWGQFLALFGVNGAGKTTLLRILSTQSRAEAGKVLVAGYDSRRQAEAVRRRIGVVGHRGLLYDDLTCRENLVFYGRLFALKDNHQRVEAVLSRVGLNHRADHRVRTLSHGMQKRLAIARAVLHHPRILLLDEPEGGLDQESVAMLKGLLEEWTQTGGTVLMTTHNVELGLAWAHRAAVLCDGKVHFQEDPNHNGAAEIQRLLTRSSRAGLSRPVGTQL